MGFMIDKVKKYITNVNIVDQLKHSSTKEKNKKVDTSSGLVGLHTLYKAGRQNVPPAPRKSVHLWSI